ncbi:class I SAM-dependent methyltransferase [Vogesella sp. LIG4]|uniref:class I SAM-dependent methyltransferase n=1 Tax=Vogesella sp. LIG4 TaxID=1192162 RepID=UPI00081FDE99|nr:class I SAM-dependent methyltransferase [Vogesella sp. LIG4]SCK11574.1 Methylase involved in ubiquinone/menaquinone biosynthesis [Vogesella sp. LIG4]
MQAHQHATTRQFDPQAQAYLGSAVHAAGPDLAAARDLLAANLPGSARALDVGCGAGHLAFTLAPLLAGITALDPAPSMLDTVASAAAERGLANIATCAGHAGALPFADGSFDLVASRYSAHHWLDLAAGVADMRRVTAPGGYVLIIDVEAPQDALADTHLQCWELLRDSSHLRDRSDAEWRALLADAGIELLAHQRWPLRLEFDSWVKRMRTPAEKVAMLRQLQQEAPQEVAAALQLEADGSFTAQTGLWWGRVL